MLTRDSGVPGTEPLCDICKERPWAADKPIYLSAGYREFVCGARLCSECQAVIEAVLDELADRKVSQEMRTENWGK